MRKLTIAGILALGLIFGALDGVLAQSRREIRGLVLDSTDQVALSGATVGALVPGTASTPEGSSTITDLDGRFRFDVPAGTTHIIVVYIGYARRIVPITEDFLRITLVPETTEIEEVIVTGYGKIDRRKSTASVASVDLGQVSKSVMSVDNMLGGQLAGVSVVPTSGTPGAAAKIRIRGTSSLQGTQDPLWVLDGMPLEGTELPKVEDLASIDQLYSSAIAGVNPEDIASISVLRDAAATAIYGARAANGVIIITTKKGQEGTVRVNYSGKTSLTEKPDITRLHLLNTEQKIALELDLAKGDYAFREEKGEVSRILRRHDVWESYRDQGMAGLSPGALASLDSLRGMETDWNALLFRLALSQDHYVSLSGGGSRATYFVSLGYYNAQGTTRGVGSDRYHITAKTHFNFWDRVRLGVSIFANQRTNLSYLTNQEGFTNPVFYSRRVNPYLAPRQEDGSFLYDPDMVAYGRNADVLPFNFLEERENTEHRLQTRSATVLMDLDIRIWGGLRLESQLGLQYDDRKNYSYAGESSYALRKDRFRSELKGQPFLPAGGRIQNGAGTSFQYTFKNMLRYSELLASIHSVEFMLGAELRRAQDEDVWATAYGYDDRTLTTKPVIFPPESSWSRIFPLFRRNYFENAFASFFSTASYTLLNRYTLGASVRFDGSNLFGVDPKYKYLPLYSLSAMWNVREEAWMQDQEILSDLRLRLSYGLQGNIDKSTSSKLLGEWKDEVSILPGEGEKNIAVMRPPNTRLRWEKTATYNAGIDLALWHHRYKLSLDGYYRRSTDLIGMRMLPLESGFDYTMVNWSSLTNAGVEVNLSLLLLQTTDWRLEVSGNFSYNRNRIDRLTVRNDSPLPSGEGYPVGAIFTLPYAGIDSEGYPLLRAPDGREVLITELMDLFMLGPSVGSRLTPAEQRARYQYAGTDEPPYSTGLSLNLKWRGLTLSTSVVGNFGHKFLVQPYYSFTRYDRSLNTSDHILDRWPHGESPRLIAEDALGGSRQREYKAYDEMNLQNRLDLYVRDAGYLRLQSLSLRWDLPKRWIERIRLTAFSLGLEARNLAVYGFDYEGFLDPETMKNPFAQPIPRTYTLSLNLGF